MDIKPPPLSDRIIRPGRGVFAAVGLRRVLAPGKVNITRDDFSRGVKLEAELWATVYRFVAGEREAGPLPKYDHDDVSTLLAASLDEAALRDDLAQFKGHPGGDDFIAAASQAAKYLKGKIPRRYRVTWTGPKESPPSRSELIPWRRTLEAVGNPLWAVQQLLAATLERSHIDALAEVWPDVLQVVRAAFEEAKADAIEQDPAWQPTRRQARQIAVLLQKDPTAPPALVAALQETFVQEAKEQAAQARQAKPPNNGLETPVQRVAGR